MMKNIYTVSQVNQYIKNMFTQDFMLSRIYVRGEVSNCKYHPKGHIYFSLKDESGSISCILFAGNRKGLPFRMQDGQQVAVFGAISVYERDGTYQLYAREIVLDGAGILAQRFQELKEELEEMGMFAPEYKQPIPAFAKKIGIVTAPSGAAVRDIIHIAKRRNPYIELILSPALVQGAEAAPSIVKALERIQKEDVDIIIVGRGGGSMEDLWAFNEEEVARAIFDCPIPVISAVGHETDTTIADYVADLRAPTPSAAAELAVYDCRAVKDEMETRRQSLKREINRQTAIRKMRLSQEYEVFRRLHPGTRIAEKRKRLADLEMRIREGMDIKIQRQRQRLAVQIETFSGLSPVSRLNQGYAFVQDETRHAVRTTGQVRQGDRLTLYVTDGTIHTIVERIKKNDDGDQRNL